ncbi:hypothetical protein [Lacticaseibacillus rhamnosus]|uniref:hypothetical protein n=1 Tax=Lacticaseibacillus rhamnosus TaxID=47715 RepID=UPI000A699BBE
MTIIPENPTLKYFCPVIALLFYIMRKETDALMTGKQRHELIDGGNVHEERY